MFSSAFTPLPGVVESCRAVSRVQEEPINGTDTHSYQDFKRFPAVAPGLMFVSKLSRGATPLCHSQGSCLLWILVNFYNIFAVKNHWCSIMMLETDVLSGLIASYSQNIQTRKKIKGPRFHPSLPLLIEFIQQLPLLLEYIGTSSNFL